MKIVTFNVNSINARLPNVLKWLGETSPDVVLLQELKCMEEKFPLMEIEDAGYNAAILGQKTYNGVAILSKHPLSDITKGLPNQPAPEEARYIEALVEGPEIVRVASIYVPNGGEVGSDKFEKKLNFLEALKAHAETLLSYEEKLVLGADYNVAPTDMDVYAPDRLRETTCFHSEEQKRFRAIEHLGLYDAFRSLYPDRQQFTWWDYRGGGYDNNHGYRIDHLLCSPQAMDILESSDVDQNVRAEQKASDHAPTWITLAA